VCVCVCVCVGRERERERERERGRKGKSVWTHLLLHALACNVYVWAHNPLWYIWCKHVRTLPVYMNKHSAYHYPHAYLFMISVLPGHRSHARTRKYWLGENDFDRTVSAMSRICMLTENFNTLYSNEICLFEPTNWHCQDMRSNELQLQSSQSGAQIFSEQILLQTL